MAAVLQQVPSPVGDWGPAAARLRQTLFGDPADASACIRATISVQRTHVLRWCTKVPGGWHFKPLPCLPRRRESATTALALGPRAPSVRCPIEATCIPDLFAAPPAPYPQASGGPQLFYFFFCAAPLWRRVYRLCNSLKACTPLQAPVARERSSTRGSRAAEQPAPGTPARQCRHARATARRSSRPASAGPGGGGSGAGPSRSPAAAAGARPTAVVRSSGARGLAQPGGGRGGPRRPRDPGAVDVSVSAAA